MLSLVRRMIERDPGTALIGPAIELRMIGRKALELLGMASLAGRVAHKRQVMSCTMMFAMASATGKLAARIDIARSNLYLLGYRHKFLVDTMSEQGGVDRKLFLVAFHAERTLRWFGKLRFKGMRKPLEQGLITGRVATRAALCLVATSCNQLGVMDR